MEAAGITLVGSVRTGRKGGVVSFTARQTGEPVNVAVLPFVSQRYAVRAAQLVASTPAGEGRRLRRNGPRGARRTCRPASPPTRSMW